jgi:hypothetical protein
LICPVFGYAFSKDHSFVLNHSISDSVLGFKKPFFQSYPFSLSFSVHEEEGEELGNIPILDRQDSPRLNQGFSFYGEPRQRRDRTILQTDYAKQKSLSSLTVQRRIDYRKALIIGGLNVLAISAGFHEAVNTWGKSKSKFHLKDDWKGDGLAQTDEISHFLWGYKMTQFLYWAYDWVGFSPKTSRTISLCESSLILTLVEYPIDAYNPQQGLGVSDLIFDYLGVGMALAKKHYGWLNDFDFKISWKKNVFSENQTLFAQTYEEFDNFIYWLTYRTKFFFPKKLLCFGLGYSATRSGLGPQREFYGGMGLSIPDFASLFGKRVGDFSKFLEILYPNIHMKL